MHTYTCFFSPQNLTWGMTAWAKCLKCHCKNCLTELKNAITVSPPRDIKTLCLIQEGTFEFAWLAEQPAVTLAGSCAYGFKTLPGLIHSGEVIALARSCDTWNITACGAELRYAPMQSHPSCINILLPEMSQSSWLEFRAQAKCLWCNIC